MNVQDLLFESQTDEWKISFCLQRHPEHINKKNLMDNP